ncbi:islet amyloid polypeptide-like [Catharus ustulatus]|uniref:Calcitonin peptide-like domain-containing protein n=2 Tax=Catharus TaxID=9184 RepID=A0A8C3VBT5_CATUS|nr:islet amyloid polypeptide-like [Catharus ustulatus]XP_032913686.1 islet amyloid polypeptide-like [Catharus ustulatus]XP_032914681.1 islet amyloid polypeptide-like [Catharus ustulatus]XP_032914682.1 islet amyloid polypeptide-like [Catharus ustulatus]NXQ39428.1 IAPP protein [Catharus fuscescens]
MCNLKLSVFFIALSVTLSCLEATPIERLLSVNDDLSDGTSKRQGWMLPVMSQNTLSGLGEEMPEQPAAETKSHQLEKRKCNTATCVTQRLADFLVRSSSSIGAVYSPTNVGSNTYGKRDTAGPASREPQNHAQL